MGRVGTGKTTVARQLGSELDWPVFSSDQIRKMLAGIPLTERTPPELRDKMYSERMSDQTYKKLLEQGLAALEAHGGVVLDATFSSRANRKFLRTACSNVRLQVVELDTDRGKIESRLKARDRSASEISDARLEDLEKLNAAYEPPSELAPGLIKISADNAVSNTVKAVFEQLAEKSASSPQRIRPVADRTDSSLGEQLR
jgi:predicted kinase